MSTTGDFPFSRRHYGPLSEKSKVQARRLSLQRGWSNLWPMGQVGAFGSIQEFLGHGRMPLLPWLPLSVNVEVTDICTNMEICVCIPFCHSFLDCILCVCTCPGTSGRSTRWSYKSPGGQPRLWQPERSLLNSWKHHMPAGWPYQSLSLSSNFIPSVEYKHLPPGIAVSIETLAASV